jgi:trimeric autotransporter adhesin
LLLAPAPASVFGIVSGYNYGGPACTSASVAGTPAQPQTTGTSITLTATATACTHPEFEFFVQPPNGAWTPVTGMLTWPQNTFTWTTTGANPGVWGIGVWARHSGSTARYEVYDLSTFQLGGTCTSTALAITPAQPQAKGTVETLTATSTGCPNPQYKFWIKIGTIWASFGPYSGSTTATWRTASYHFKSGKTYQVGVWARQVGSSRKYDTYSIVSFRLT